MGTIFPSDIYRRWSLLTLSWQLVCQQNFVHPDTVPNKSYPCRGEGSLTPAHRNRYISVVLLVVSDFGYFYHGFSATTCSTYYMAAPVLKGG